MEPRIIIAASALAVAGLVLAGLAATALGSAKAAAKWPSAERPKLGLTPARIGVGLGVVFCVAAAGLAASMAPVDNVFAWVAIIAVAALIVLGLTAWAAVKLASKIELSALINSPSPMSGEPQTAMSRPGTQPSVATGSPVHVTPRPTADEIAYGQPYPGVVSTYATPPGSPPPESPTAPPEVAAGPPPGSYVDEVHTTTPESSAPATRSGSAASLEPYLPPGASTATDRPDPAVPSEALPGWVYTDEADNWYLVSSVPDGLRLLRLSDFTLQPPGSAAGRLKLAGSVEMTVWPADTEDSDTEERPAENK
ncbi:MAG TPA: hypothetical protein VE172_02825 [Stackebrandtia sp.]|uniref:hypothetical protein n=1 Tax=Stackebrandtia sp. TaxID=2023065 RepID=UPI002D526E5B|nr:hypothetical protein [Stackebrandtia sp.]HZE37721.1 hypothetical protein [Stackebrandtia sp.]